MGKSIAQYQKAFNNVVERLKGNDNVLAVMVFGSMVTGDLWKESDIDFFVIMKMGPSDITNVYTEENKVDIHIKLVSKEKFVKLHKSDLRGGFIHRIFASSRLVFSKDLEVTEVYNDRRYYPDYDRERWNIAYLGKVIKSLDLCRKYISNNSIYTAYTICVKCIEDYSKLYINSSGYMISNDAITMAINLSDDYKECAEKLLVSNGSIEKNIKDTIIFLQQAVDSILKECTSLLISFMESKGCYLSSEDIKKSEIFEHFNIDFEAILNYLWKKDIVKKSNREYRDNTGGVIVKENVYFI